MIATIGRFFYLQTIAVFFERQAEPAPNSRTRLLQIETQRSRADRLPPAALGGLSPHPIREQGSCKSRLNVLAQIACLRLRSFVGKLGAAR